MNNGFLIKIHSYFGLIAGLFIFLMSISGAVLVFHSNLDTFQQPNVLLNNGVYAGTDEYYVSIKKQFPKAQISNCVLPEKNDKPVSFIIYDSSYKNGAKALEVFLHPQTAKVLTTRGGSNDFRNNFMSWLSKFHNSFHAGKTGEWLLGLFAIVFLLSLITGIILFRRKIIAVLMFDKAVYNSKNLHQVIGVYALLFNLMIAVTGFWMQRYVFKKEFYAAYEYQPILKASPPLNFKFDAAYAEIKKHYPDFTAHVIYFAQSNKGKTAVYGSRSRNAYIHSKKFADVIFLDSTGLISNTRFINEIDADDRYDIINSQIHMGNYGGLGIKIIYFLFGLSGSLLSITGFLMWYRKKLKNR
ncbi:MAG TPA: PepSY-associated TM helix domain-containing protein [Ferruginibacter sp.]|nr:PepSY-associated TM helix domain-containing protein [Ferruginibacter sp.]